MPILCVGGCTFAEHPGLAAPQARILWHAAIDPATLVVRASPSGGAVADAIDPSLLAPWMTLVADAAGEHGVLSDGWHHIRIDIEQGSMAAGLPVTLNYRLRGIVSAEPKILPLRRFIDLCRRRRFSASLYPPDPRVKRWLLALRVHDALRTGANQHEIARVLFRGLADTTIDDWRDQPLRSRLRRLVDDARWMAAGGYRTLLHSAGSSPREPSTKRA